MSEHELLVERFEEQRPHLRAVAYRMLGSLSEADDAVQETWLRVSRADRDGIENLRGWLTTIVARLCLTTLKSRKARPEEPFAPHVPDPIVSPEDGVDPEHEALLADSVGLALLVLFDALAPAERLAFVLHDMFAVPFKEIAPIVERSPAATRQLASRPAAGCREQPDSRRRPKQPAKGRRRLPRRLPRGRFRCPDRGPRPRHCSPRRCRRRARGQIQAGSRRSAVARQSVTFARSGGGDARPALVNGAAGVVFSARGRVFSVVGFTVTRGRIVEINVLADPARLQKLDIGAA